MNTQKESARQASSSLAFSSRLHHLFFHLSFSYRLAYGYRALLWLLEKLILLTPLCLPLLDNTPWSRVNNFLINLNVCFSLYGYGQVLSHYSGGDERFAVSCFAAFAIYQIFMAIVVYRLLVPVAPTFLNFLASVGLELSHRIGLVLCSAFTFYLYSILRPDAGFSAFKHIAPNLVQPHSSTHVTLLVLYSVMLGELLLLDLGYLFLLQDTKLSIWSTRSWRLKLADLISKLGVVAVFILDQRDDHVLVTAACLGSLFLAKVVAWFWVPLSSELVAEIGDYLYDNCALLAIVQGVLCHVIYNLRFNKNRE